MAETAIVPAPHGTVLTQMAPADPPVDTARFEIIVDPADVVQVAGDPVTERLAAAEVLSSAWPSMAGDAVVVTPPNARNTRRPWRFRGREKCRPYTRTLSRVAGSQSGHEGFTTA